MSRQSDLEANTNRTPAEEAELRALRGNPAPGPTVSTFPTASSFPYSSTASTFPTVSTFPKVTAAEEAAKRQADLQNADRSRLQEELRNEIAGHKTTHDLLNGMRSDANTQRENNVKLFKILDELRAFIDGLPKGTRLL